MVQAAWPLHKHYLWELRHTSRGETFFRVRGWKTLIVVKTRTTFEGPLGVLEASNVYTFFFANESRIQNLGFENESRIQNIGFDHGRATGTGGRPN